MRKLDTSRKYLSVQVDTQQPNLIDDMKAKIDSELGKCIYARRLGIVEPVFANICVHKGKVSTVQAVVVKRYSKGRYGRHKSM